MDDILDELGGNVTYENLYKLHTGHGMMMNGFSDTDSSSESSLFTDNLRPPPYTYEELTRNLVHAEGLLPKEFDKDCENMALPSYSSICSSLPTSARISSASTIQEVSIPNGNQAVTQSEKVAHKLSQLITTESCFICEKSGPKHYKQQCHYKNVIKWLKTQLLEIKQPVDIENFFCQVCNLPLSGNNNDREHYEEKVHKERAKSFCVPCQRVIESIDMPNHCKSKKHLANMESTISRKSESVENKGKPAGPTKHKVQPPSGIAPTLPNRKETLKEEPLEDINRQSTPNFKTYACVLRGTASNKTTTMHVKTVGTKKSEPSIPQATFASRKEPEVMRPQIIPPPFNPFAILLIEQLRRTYCYLCEEAVSKEKGAHYKKKNHYKNLREWIERNGVLFGYTMNNIDSVICLACHCIFPTYKMAINHYGTKEHEKLSKYYCEVCMYHDNSDIHKEHKKIQAFQKEPVTQKAFKPKTTGHEPGTFIANKLKNMVSGPYCFLCNTINSASHDLTKQHIQNVRNWLEIMIQNTGVRLNRRIIFCEECSAVLSGTEESRRHFETEVHLYNQQTYCPICSFRGSPETVSLHYYSKAHAKNLETIIRVNMSSTESIPNGIENKVVKGGGKKEEQQKEPELIGDVKKDILKIETPKLDLHSPKKYETDSKVPPKLPDRQNISLLHLGLQFGRVSTEKLLTDDKEHAELCKNIFADYWQLITMLEIVPLEVCSRYLKKINKDIGAVYKEYLDNSDKNIPESLVTSIECDCRNIPNNPPDETTLQNKIVNDTNILENGRLCDIEMAKLKTILTKYLMQKFSHSSLNIVRGLTMLVRNFRKALEGMTAEESSLKMENIFQWNIDSYGSTIPDLEENVNAIGYEIHKLSLIQEIEQLSRFINNQTVLEPHIIVDCLIEFGKELLKKEECITAGQDDDKFLDDYFYGTDDNLNTTSDVEATKTDKDVDDKTSSLKDDILLDLPKEIDSDHRYSYSSDDSEAEKDSDTSFKSAVECLCDGWCT